MEAKYFDLVDYVVFVFLLTMSALIGVYFAFCAKQKQNSTLEYLLGGKRMGVFPISMSLIASYTSGIALLGFPSEMYTYGSQLSVMLVSEMFSSVVMATVYIPVFYNLQITSSYEYLNQRFSPTVRTFGSALFIIKMMLYIPIVIYGPALAFSQVSGFQLEWMIPTVSIVCIFYTTLGGIKAVVWTDTFQMILMLVSILAVIILGTIDVGGFETVYERNKQSGRLDVLDFSWDPTIRHTFWNVLIGKFFSHLSVCTINQAMVQRCLAMPSLEKARKTIAIFALGTFTLVCMSCYSGYVVYAAFHDCDPISTKQISKADQLLPYFVMKITNQIPGLAGIFVSGIFSAALSTMSTGLNSMCGVVMEDFIKPLHRKPFPEERASLYMKIITVFLGVVCIFLTFLVDKLGGLIQVSGSLGGITGGTLLGMFTLGMLFPWANAIGAVVGGISGFCWVAWMAVGQHLATINKEIVFPVKPVSIEGCSSDLLPVISNVTTVIVKTSDPLFPVYSISYIYYTVIGMVTVLVVGNVVSCLTGCTDTLDLDPNVFSPIIKPLIKTKKLKARLEPVKEEGQVARMTSAQRAPLIVK